MAVQNARQLYTTLCERGPFRCVSPSLFARHLRHLGGLDAALIEQAPDGVLLLAREGERVVEHYSFYPVFQTPEEYRIIADGKPLGTLPVTMVLAPDMTIIFSGRRWRITQIYDRDKVIEVTADRIGRPPSFNSEGGSAGSIHDRVVEKMKEMLSGTDLPAYLDKSAARLLEDARAEFRRLGFAQQPIYKTGKRNYLIATWTGTVKTSTLALALQSLGYKTEGYPGFLDISHGEDVQPVEAALKEIARSTTISADDVLSDGGNLMTEKFHPYLSLDLLREDAASSRLDLGALPSLARRVIGAQQGPVGSTSP